MKTIARVFKFTRNSPLFSMIMEDPAVFNPLNYLGSQWDLEGMCMCEDVCMCVSEVCMHSHSGTSLA